MTSQERSRRWRATEKGKQRQKELSAKWYQENKVKARALNKAWQQKNKARHRQLQYAWKKKTGVTQQRLRLADILRTRIKYALKGAKKAARTMQLVGCSILEFKAHIEKQFQPGMSWETHGLWEIDHIKPCAKFDLMDLEQQRACFHFSNQQPLWKAENRSKGDK